MGHTYSNILLHVTFGTKGRVPLIGDGFRQRLHEYLGGIARDEFGRALSVGGTADHVHGLLSIGTDISVGEAMSKWKSLSTGWVHRAIPGASRFAWQPGYGAFSVSHSHTEDVRAYIQGQAEHHRGRSFQEEFLLLLKRHNIPFDPKEVWA